MNTKGVNHAGTYSRKEWSLLSSNINQRPGDWQMEEKVATTRYSDPVMLEDEALDPDSTWGEPLR